MSDEPRNSEDELKEDAAVLPAREAMSIISPQPGAGYMPDLSAVPDGGEAGQQAASDAQASASEQESTRSEDRDDHFVNQDSASSQT